MGLSNTLLNNNARANLIQPTTNSKLHGLPCWSNNWMFSVPYSPEIARYRPLCPSKELGGRRATRVSTSSVKDAASRAQEAARWGEEDVSAKLEGRAV